MPLSLGTALVVAALGWPFLENPIIPLAHIVQWVPLMIGVGVMLGLVRMRWTGAYLLSGVLVVLVGGYLLLLRTSLEPLIAFLAAYNLTVGLMLLSLSAS